MSEVKVSVIMSVHNGAEHLESAIVSILEQSHSCFELIVVDDGSTDESASILDRLAKSDSRIIVIRFKSNVGLASALNAAIMSSTGKYIARMDADDLALGDRLRLQVAFMEAHPDVILSGGGIQCFDASSALWSYPKSDKACFSKLFFSPPFAHPAVIIRASLLKKFELGYDRHFVRSQDYDLWARASEHGKMANLTNLLLNYRVHSKQASQSARNDQQLFHITVSLRIWKEYLNFSTNIDTARFIVGFSLEKAGVSKKDVFKFLRSLFFAAFSNPRLSMSYTLGQSAKLLFRTVRL